MLPPRLPYSGVRWGQTPIAIVVPTDPAEPTSLVVLDQLPRNASGKVLKNELRVRYGRSRSQNGGSSV